MNSSEIAAISHARCFNNIGTNTIDTVGANILPVASRNGVFGGPQLATVTANNATAPDGTLTAATVTPTAGAGAHYNSFLANAIPAYQTAPGRSWLFAGNVKASGAAFCAATGDAGTNAGETWFNLATGQIGTKSAGNLSASFVPVGNGWFFFTVGFVNAAPNLPLPFILISNADNVNSFTAAGTESILIWGCSLVPYPISTNSAEGTAILISQNLNTRNAY